MWSWLLKSIQPLWLHHEQHLSFQVVSASSRGKWHGNLFYLFLQVCPLLPLSCGSSFMGCIGWCTVSQSVRVHVVSLAIAYYIFIIKPTCVYSKIYRIFVNEWMDKKIRKYFAGGPLWRVFIIIIIDVASSSVHGHIHRFVLIQHPFLNVRLL